MKKINKTALITVLMAFVSVSFAQQGEVLITAKSVGKNIVINYELLNEGGVSGLQFDIDLPSTQLKSLNVATCTSNFGKSEFATCGLKENKLRVIVINPSLGELDSGAIGSVVLNNTNKILDKNLKVSKAMLFNNKGAIKNIEAVLDYKDISIRDGLRNNIIHK